MLSLSYDCAGANGQRTGQLTKISNNLDHAKDRGFEYDPLGRLKRATGGQNVAWAQRYEYDRYGNRSNVYSYILEDYIKNFYQGALNRQPTSGELSSWLSTLQTAYAQGQSQFLTAMQGLGTTHFTSQEYLNRNRTDSEFVYDLYKAFLYREPDSEGYASWVSLVPVNGRDNIRLAFEWAPEFYTKVSGISPYAPSAGVTIPRDGLQGIAYNQATNRILISGWSYDAAGNQTRTQNSGGVWQRFQYDAANRLVKVKADDNTTVLATSTYGDSNERLVVEESGLRTYYAGSGIAEYIESGGSTTPAWSKSYVYLGDRLLSTLTPNGSGGEAVEYDHPDRLGTRLVTNPSIGTSFEQVNLPFGTALIAESSGATNKRFTTYDRSASTGLDYAMNRHYDSQQGRFTQVDPAGMDAASLTSPQTLNLYAYCADDPINNTDPSGLGFFSALGKFFKRFWKVIVVVAVVVAILVLTTGAGSALFGALKSLGSAIWSGVKTAANSIYSLFTNQNYPLLASLQDPLPAAPQGYEWIQTAIGPVLSQLGGSPIIVASVTTVSPSILLGAGAAATAAGYTASLGGSVASTALPQAAKTSLPRPQSNSGCHGPDTGSADISASYNPLGIGYTGGAEVTANKVYPYGGLTVGTPYRGASILGNNSADIPTGLNFSFSGGSVVGGSYSGKLDITSLRTIWSSLKAGSWRFGGTTPGASASVTYVGKGRQIPCY